MNKIHMQSAPPVASALQNKNKRQNIDPALVEAAQGMEAMFLNEMNKAMRNTIEHSDFSLNNSASDIYQSMLDSEHAEIAARQSPVGLSDLILDSWTREEYNNK